MSGGSKRSDDAFLDDVRATIDAGANGLAVGRNVFQREDPEALLDALNDVIFGTQSVQEVA
jgi:class I fructose-bisphosphate aldolase